MRYLIVTHEYEPIVSGGVSLVRHLSIQLARLGHEVIVLAPKLPGTEKVSSPEAGVEVVFVETFRKSLGNAGIIDLVGFGLLVIPSLIKNVRQRQVDAVLSIFLVPAGFSSMVASALTGVRHVTFIGGADLPDVSSKNQGVLGWLKGILRMIVRISDAVLVAEGLEEFARPIAGNSPMTTVRNGADLSSIVPRERFSTERSPIKLLTVGRLIERKGSLHLVQALAEMAPEQRKLFHLTIVGYGPIEEKLKHEIQKHGLSEIVILAGQVAPTDLAEYFHAADAYVFYAAPEGNSLAMVEAMAHGLPVLTSDVSGNRELVDGNGMTVPFDNVAALGEALIALCKARPDFLQWGSRSRELSRRYDWKEIAKVYERALANPER